MQKNNNYLCTGSVFKVMEYKLTYLFQKQSSCT